MPVVAAVPVEVLLADPGLVATPVSVAVAIPEPLAEAVA
jgi:hypothetical protein